MNDHQPTSPTRYVRIVDAAAILGISERAVRKRVQTNSIESKLIDGRLHVAVPAESVPEPVPEPEAQVPELEHSVPEPGPAVPELTEPDLLAALRSEVQELRTELLVVRERADQFANQLVETRADRDRWHAAWQEESAARLADGRENRFILASVAGAGERADADLAGTSETREDRPGRTEPEDATPTSTSSADVDLDDHASPVGGTGSGTAEPSAEPVPELSEPVPEPADRSFRSRIGGWFGRN